jgi:hypothetical protein
MSETIHSTAVDIAAAPARAGRIGGGDEDMTKTNPGNASMVRSVLRRAALTALFLSLTPLWRPVQAEAPPQCAPAAPDQVRLQISVSGMRRTTRTTTVHFDTTLLGLPAEGLGFSNNPTLYLGPPDLSQVRFEAHPGDNPISVQMKYY